MNKKFVYADGKVIVIGNNDDDSIREYTDNIEDILVQENVIEKLEKELEEEREKLINLKSSIKSYTGYYSGGIVIVALGIVGAIALLTPLEAYPLLAWTGVATFSGGLAILEIVLIRQWIREYKKTKKGIQITENNITYMIKELENQDEKLAELRHDKTNTEEQKFADENGIKNNHFNLLNGHEIIYTLEQSLSCEHKETVNGMIEATGDPSFKYRKDRSKVLKPKIKK